MDHQKIYPDNGRCCAGGGDSVLRPSPSQITYSIISSHLHLERGLQNDGRGWSRYHAV